jgi:hypothetical protein
MSKNHLHDNIYSILGKLEALQPTTQEKHDATVQQIRESVESQGSILKGLREVGSVEQRLAKQFAESKIEEKAVSQAQQKFMGMVHAAQKGEKAASPAVAKVAKGMGKKDARDFAATKHKGLPAHVEEGTCNECGMTEGSCEHTMSESDDDQFSKILDACAAIYRVQYDGGDEIWDADWMQDWAHSLEQANPTDQELDFIIANGKMPKRLSTVEFNVGDDFQFSEAEITRKPGVTTHRKTDFPGYPSDDLDDSEEDENKGKRGRPRKHAKKADSDKKKGRGRPKKEKAPEYDKRHDPFGRVKAGAEKSGKADKKSAIDGGERVAKRKAKMTSTVEEAMTRLQKRLTEGVNFAELLREKQQTVDEMLAELGNDIKVFKETGHCSELLRDCMEIKGYHGKMVADEAAQVPSKLDQFGKPDPFAHVKPDAKLSGIPGNLPPNQIPGKQALLKGQGRNYYEENDLEQELNELARLAGLDEVSRGEYIKQQDTAAEKSGKNKFNAFGQIFNTDEIKEEPNEGNVFTKGLADDDVEVGEKIPGTDAIKTKDIDEDKIDVADAPEATNKPRPKYSSIKQITTQGDDLHRQKSQHPAAAAKGDNPLTNKLTLEDRLAAEYESIKKVGK